MESREREMVGFNYRNECLTGSRLLNILETSQSVLFLWKGRSSSFPGLVTK